MWRRSGSGISGTNMLTQPSAYMRTVGSACAKSERNFGTSVASASADSLSGESSQILWRAASAPCISCGSGLSRCWYSVGSSAGHCASPSSSMVIVVMHVPTTLRMYGTGSPMQPSRCSRTYLRRETEGAAGHEWACRWLAHAPGGTRVRGRVLLSTSAGVRAGGSARLDVGRRRLPVLLDVVLEHQPGRLPHVLILLSQLVEDEDEVAIIVGHRVERAQLLKDVSMLLVVRALRGLEETQQLL